MFLLDTNAFIEADRLYYSYALAPGFWDWLQNPALEGAVASIDAVRKEITAGTGHLVDWAKRLRESFWLPDDDDVVAKMMEISSWAVAPERVFNQAAVDEFMASADLWLVAHAAASGATVCTREQPAPEAKKRVKIPDVCNAFSVPWLDPFTVYKQLGLRLNL